MNYIAVRECAPFYQDSIQAEHGMVFRAKDNREAVRRLDGLPAEYVQIREWNPESEDLLRRQGIVCNRGSEWFRGMLEGHD